MSTVTGALNRTMRGLLANGVVERTIPDKPTSRLQKCRLTAKGRAVLKQGAQEAGK